MLLDVMGPQRPIKNKTQLKRENYFSLKKTDLLCQGKH